MFTDGWRGPRPVNAARRGAAPAIAARLALFAIVLPTLLATDAAVGQTSEPLYRVTSVDLPGPPGKRFDYLLVDRDDGWLFSAHLAASQTYVVDLKTNQVLHTITDTAGVEGLAYVSEERKLYTSNAFDNTIGVVDLNTMQVVRKIATENKPDGIAYVPPARKIYVSNELAKAISAIDTRTDKVVAVIRFDSQTGVPGYDPGLGLVYVNLQDRNELAAIDPATDKEVARYPVEGCQANHGMDLDTEHHLAFIACQRNSRFVVFDLKEHKVLVTFPIPLGSDVVAFDPGLGRVYVGCAVGTIAVFQEDDPTHFRPLTPVRAEPFIHSLAVDPITHRVYVPEQEEAGASVARLVVFEAAPR